MTKERRQKRKELYDILSQYQGRPIREIKKAICGKRIGTGAFRDVYECKIDKEYWVIKIERRVDLVFANITEWRNYVQYCESPIGKWLCPIETIDSTGSILVMRRASFKNKFVDYPQKMPVAFNDFKIENYGFIEDQCVCVDYSFLLINDGDKDFKNVKWWRVERKKK